MNNLCSLPKGTKLIVVSKTGEFKSPVLIVEQSSLRSDRGSENYKIIRGLKISLGERNGARVANELINIWVGDSDDSLREPTEAELKTLSWEWCPR